MRANNVIFAFVVISFFFVGGWGWGGAGSTNGQISAKKGSAGKILGTTMLVLFLSTNEHDNIHDLQQPFTTPE